MPTRFVEHARLTVHRVFAASLVCTVGGTLGCGDSAASDTTSLGSTSVLATGDSDEPATSNAQTSAAPTDDGEPTRGSPPGTGDAADSTEDSTGDPSCAPLPASDPDWLQPMQTQIVGQLSGAEPIADGVTLSDRATPANRATTRTYLMEQWDELGLEGQMHTYSDSGTNIYAALPATIETDRTLVIGAHFDTVPSSPGANDNATGVAMVLALGRWLQQVQCRDVNVLLVLFDEEEIGLVGSFAFASWLSGQPLDVLEVHTIDQMGWDADGDRAVELERADPGLFEQYEAAEPVAPGMTPLIATQTGFTDHVSFRKLGFDAIGVTEEFVSGDTTPHYHLPSDTFETVDFGYLASTSALLHVTIGQRIVGE